MQRSILSQILDTTLGPESAPVASKPANSTQLDAAPKPSNYTAPTPANATLLEATPKPSNYTAPTPANGTLLSGDAIYLRKAAPIIGTQLAGNQTYISASANLKPTLFGGGGGQTYTEIAFKAASSYKPPITRQPIAFPGFVGGGVVPGGPGQGSPTPTITNGLLIDINSFLLINSTDKFII